MEKEADAARVAEEKRKAEEWGAIPDSRKIEMLFEDVAALVTAINNLAGVIDMLVRKTNRLADPVKSTEIVSPPPFACRGIIQP